MCYALSHIEACLGEASSMYLKPYTSTQGENTKTTVIDTNNPDVNWQSLCNSLHSIALNFACLIQSHALKYRLNKKRDK